MLRTLSLSILALSALGAPSEATPAQLGAPLEVLEISNGSGGMEGQLDFGGNFGQALAPLGDLDADGNPDLIAGAPNTANGGASYVMFLNADGSVRASHRIDTASGDLCVALSSGDEFGSAMVALGDIDQDGQVEVAVGAAEIDIGGINRGAVFVLSLRSDGTASACTVIGSGAGGFGGGLGNDDSFGSSLALLGDLDGDGIDELAVGATQDTLFGSTGEGAAWILFLRSDGTVRAKQEISEGVGGFSGPLGSEDWFGSSVAGPGDLNGDGVPDLLVGARNDDDAGIDAGAVYALFLQADGLVLSRAKITTGLHGFDGQLTFGGWFGGGMHVLPDLDGNGFRDILVGIPGVDQQFVREAGGYWAFTSSANGVVLLEHETRAIDMPASYSFSVGDDLGISFAYLGDMDGDGAPTVAFGTPGQLVLGTGRVWMTEICDTDPLPAFSTLGATTGASPLTVTFTDESTGTALSTWAWDFGDGTASTEQSPTHTFTKVGTYDIALTVTGADGTCTVTQEALVVVDSASAQATSRNGSGTNPDIFSSTTLPILGTDWTSLVDATSLGTTGLVFVIGYEGALSGISTSFGEVLIDPTTPFQLLDVGVLVAGQSVHSIAVPNDIALLGCTVSAQALLNNPGQLTNAIDLILGT